MATVKASFTDNSAKDGTNDLINGSEVDLNPELLADVLDGTQQTALGQSGNITFSDGSGVVIGHTAQATGIARPTARRSARPPWAAASTTPTSRRSATDWTTTATA